MVKGVLFAVIYLIALLVGLIGDWHLCIRSWLIIETTAPVSIRALVKTSFIDAGINMAPDTVETICAAYFDAWIT